MEAVTAIRQMDAHVRHIELFPYEDRDDVNVLASRSNEVLARAHVASTAGKRPLIKSSFEISSSEFEKSLQKSSDPFQDAVDKAKTEVSVLELESEPVIDDSDGSLDGTYKLEYEDDGKLVTATTELRFTSGFGGWTIQGTRKNKNEEGMLNIRKGFLAQSGQLYWVERADFEPYHSVLVRGKVTPDGPFRGKWLSSDVSRNGIVTEFHRVRRAGDNDTSGKLDAADLV